MFCMCQVKLEVRYQASANFVRLMREKILVLNMGKIVKPLIAMTSV